MSEDIKTILSLANQKGQTEKRFVCYDCNNTGKIEVLQYLGKDIHGLVRTGAEIVGFNRWFKMCLQYYRIVNPALPIECGEDMHRYYIELKKAKEIYDVDTQIRTIAIHNCTSCKRAQWTK